MDINCEGFSTMLEKIFERDDETSFVKFLQDHPIEHEIINSLVNKCVDFGARKCLLSLIRGDISGLCPTLDAQIPDSGVTALAYVSHSFPEPHVINLMLTNCGGTCLVNVGSTIGQLRGLPIHFVLINLSLMDHIYSWYRGGSLIKLIILLCLWETKPILDSARLLVQYTDSINDIAWTLLKNGGLTQFTALLLIAREKVIAPFDSGFTIYEYITSEIDSVAEGDLSIEQDEYKCMLMDARKLLTGFEVFGDDLSSYCSSMHKYVPVEEVRKDVCGLLIKKRVMVQVEDIYLSGCIKYSENAGAISSITSMIEDGCDINSLIVWPASSSAYHGSISSSRPVRSTAFSIPNLACLASQTRAYSTRACQTRNIGMSLQHTCLRPMPRRLAYIAMKFINGFRFA